MARVPQIRLAGEIGQARRRERIADRRQFLEVGTDKGGIRIDAEVFEAGDEEERRLEADLAPQDMPAGAVLWRGDGVGHTVERLAGLGIADVGADLLVIPGHRQQPVLVEIPLGREIRLCCHERVQHRVAARSGVAGRIVAEVGAAAQFIERRARQDLGDTRVHHQVARGVERQVEAGQHAEVVVVVGHRAVGGDVGRAVPRGHALEGVAAGGDIDQPHADVAGDRHTAGMAGKVRLHIAFGVMLQHAPVLRIIAGAGGVGDRGDLVEVAIDQVGHGDAGVVHAEFAQRGAAGVERNRGAARGEALHPVGIAQARAQPGQETTVQLVIAIDLRRRQRIAEMLRPGVAGGVEVLQAGLRGIEALGDAGQHARRRVEADRLRIDVRFRRVPRIGAHRLRVRSVELHGVVAIAVLGVGTGGEEVLVLGVLRDDVGDRGVVVQCARDDIVARDRELARLIDVAGAADGAAPVAPAVAVAVPLLVLRLVDLDVRIEDVGVDVPVGAGLPLERAGGAPTGFGGGIDLGLGAPGGVDRLAVIGRRVVAGGVGLVIAPALERDLAVLLLLIAAADHDREIVRELGDVLRAAAAAPGAVMRDILAALAGLRAGAHGQGRAGVVQRAQRADVDRRGDAASDQVGALRLVDSDARDVLRRVDFPADVAIGLGCRDLAAVDQAQHEARAEAAHRHLAVVAAIAAGGDARQAGEFVGDGDIGQRADVLGRNRLGHQRRHALGVESVAQRGADAGHDDRVAGIGGLGVGGRGLGQRGRGRRSHGEQAGDVCQRAHSRSHVLSPWVPYGRCRHLSHK